MNEINLTNLRLQIESLVHSRKQLLLENNILRKKIAKLMQERAILVETKDKTIKKVKDIIDRIRNEINESRKK